MERNKPGNKRRGEGWRPPLCSALLLAGAASMVAAAFLAGRAMGFLALGAAAVLFAVLIQASGGDGPC